MKKSSRDALLMLAPVAVLGMFGWLLSARKPAIIEPTGPFQPFIHRVQVLPARPIDVFDGYDTRVVVEFGARGQLPAWWTNGGNSYYSRNSGQLVGVKGNKTTPLKKTAYLDSPHFDSQSKSWVATYNLKLREVAPQSGQIRFRDTVKFTDNHENTIAKLWLDTLLRANGVTTQMPTVSRVAGVKIEKFSLDPAPPTESHDGTVRWRAKWTLLENLPREGAEKNAKGANIRVEIVNGKGEELGSQGSSTYSSQDEIPTVTNNDPRRIFIREDYSLDTGPYAHVPATNSRDPLWLQGSIRSGDKWPLAVKIPLRDATGKMLFAPRTPTMPFRVVSATLVAPASDEVKDYGADTVIKVVLKAWNPKVDISRWKWEADYSQHLRSAKSGLFWELPFRSGKAPIGVSYNWDNDNSRIELRYLLATKSIPTTAGKLIFHADIAANRSRRVPVEVTVRP